MFYLSPMDRESERVHAPRKGCHSQRCRSTSLGKAEREIRNQLQERQTGSVILVERTASEILNSMEALMNNMAVPADFDCGYPVNLFVQTDSDKFLCGLCHKILREPIQSFCGHRFCKGCIDKALNGQQMTCSQCEQEGIVEDEYSVLKADQMYPDNAVKREMSRIKVQCLNTGCSWQGIFKDYEEHYKVCPKHPLICEQCKTKNIPGDRVEGNSLQKLMEETAGNHLVFVMRQVDNINQRVTHLEEKINNISGSEILLLERWVLNTADKVNQMEQTVASLVSHPFSNSGTQRQHVRSSEMQMRVQQVEIKTDPFGAFVTVLYCEIDQCITTLGMIDQERKVDREMIESNEQRSQSLERSLALMDKTIIDLNARIQSLEYASYDGTLVWQIQEFSKHRHEAQQGKTFSIYSPAFYTSHTGYKMCVQMYPNGDGTGKGSHMSLFFVIMRGPYDALLSWPFMQRVTFMLIDQNNREHVIDSFRPDPASSSCKRPTSDMNIASGSPLFIPHKRLDDPNYGYLKEDTMFIKTVVDKAISSPLEWQ